MGRAALAEVVHNNFMGKDLKIQAFLQEREETLSVHAPLCIWF
jgi:hypothetical protein